MKKSIKTLMIVSLLIFLTVMYMYVANITLMPKSITLLQGETLKFATLWGIEFKEANTNILETANNLNQSKIAEVRKNRYEYKFI